MKVIIFILLLTSSFSQAYAYRKTPLNECSPVDFRETFNLEMRNQHEVSWCFAHAAADLLQYANQVPEQISAADIAIRYSRTDISKLIQFFKGIFNRNSTPLPAQTGFIKIAVDKILPEGYCPETVFPSEEWLRIPQFENVPVKKVEIQQALLDLFSLHQQVRQGNFRSPSELPWVYQFKNIKPEQFFEILRSSTPSNLISNLQTQACFGERKPFPQEKLKPYFRIKNPYTFVSMNHNLNHQMPVTIDFFSDVFRNFNHPKKKIEDLHTVLIYGRRPNPATGKCEYLIKDSYGKQCSKYDPLIQCEDGYVWMPENKLYRSMTSYLELR